VWPSSVSLYFVSRLAAEHVKVVLTGEGSDELFGGYHRYRTYMLQHPFIRPWSAVPGPLRGAVRNGIANSSLVSATLKRKIGHTFLGREASFEALFIENFYAAFSRESQTNLLREGTARTALDSFVRYWTDSAGSGRTLLERLLYTDRKTYLVELLMKQDQMSMACSIESRVPFLDHEFAAFAATVPDNLKIRNGSGKYILKKAVEGLLPNDIIYRRKMGFPTPLRDWLRDERASSLFARLTDRRGFLAEYINPEAVQALVDRHRSGFEDGTDRLWRLINFQIWGDVFFNRVPVETLAETVGR
jgi:asparagine synthase (glutamine-hydrolysing)